MPFYPEIQLSIQPIKLWRMLNQRQPERLHIVTEGAMGLVARMKEIIIALMRKTITIAQAVLKSETSFNPELHAH